MNDTFHLVDLVSQGRAVNRLLAGRTDEEKIRWIASKGQLELLPSSDPQYRDAYRFTSSVQREAIFFLDDGELVFFGDHTTFTVGSDDDAIT